MNLSREFEAPVANNPISPSAATRGIQLQLITPLRRPPPVAVVEPKGVVFTKRWVVELLLDLSGYCSDKNLVDALTVEPAAGDGAFLGLMVERLVESCRSLGRSLSECQHSLTAYELDEESAARARTFVQNVLMNRGVKAPASQTIGRSMGIKPGLPSRCRQQTGRFYYREPSLRTA